MRVLFDDQIFTTQRHGGISRYFAELLVAFAQDPSLLVDSCTPRWWSQNAHLTQAGLARTLPQRLNRMGRVTRAVNGRIPTRRTPDLIHHTYYDERYLNRYGRQVLRATTVHDMIPEIYPDLFKTGNPHGAKSRYVAESNLIVCVSEATKRDLLEIYGAPNAPVHVAHHGVDRRVFHPPAVGDIPPANQRYVLFVGRRPGYKDFVVALRGFAAARIPTDVMLVVAGGGPFDSAEREMLHHFKIVGRVRQTVATDEQLSALYAHAECFVFPSRYEGFGLPTLEAMSCGCPTILARCSAHPEVGGMAASYFSPGCHEDLALRIEEVVHDPELRANLRAAGINHSRTFTWHRTARMTASAYRDLAIAPA